MKKEEFIRIIKFLLFSISAGLVQILGFTLLYEVFAVPWRWSYLAALILSVIWNFTLNREFTFKSSGNIPVAMVKTLAYYAVFTPASTVLGDWLVEGLFWNEYVVTVLNMVLNFVTEFLYQRFFVFGKSIDTKIKGEK